VSRRECAQGETSLKLETVIIHQIERTVLLYLVAFEKSFVRLGILFVWSVFVNPIVVKKRISVVPKVAAA
jgi:hypothetical protein